MMSMTDTATEMTSHKTAMILLSDYHYKDDVYDENNVDSSSNNNNNDSNETKFE